MTSFHAKAGKRTRFVVYLGSLWRHREDLYPHESGRVTISSQSPSHHLR
jgi:hypothetical protein